MEQDTLLLANMVTLTGKLNSINIKISLFYVISYKILTSSEKSLIKRSVIGKENSIIVYGKSISSMKITFLKW